MSAVRSFFARIIERDEHIPCTLTYTDRFYLLPLSVGLLPGDRHPLDGQLLQSCNALVIHHDAPRLNLF